MPPSITFLKKVYLKWQHTPQKVLSKGISAAGRNKWASSPNIKNGKDCTKNRTSLTLYHWTYIDKSGKNGTAYFLTETTSIPNGCKFCGNTFKQFIKSKKAMVNHFQGVVVMEGGKRGINPFTKSNQNYTPSTNKKHIHTFKRNLSVQYDEVFLRSHGMNLQL